MRLTIQDTGAGIPPEVIGRLFEPFFTTKGIGEGTGMGLAIVHGIVTSYEGAITVESTPEAGSMFTIYLPRLTEAMEAQPSEPPKPLPPGHGCILFVDDEGLLVRLAQQTLASFGYKVVASVSSVDALDTFRAQPERFNLVITDQTMPVMTGEELARELRRIRDDIPIVLCTGLSQVIDAAKAQALGIAACLMKPVEETELVATIQRVLGQRSASDR